MAFATPPDAPRARPSTVNFAVYLLYAVAALQIIGLILGAIYYSALQSGTKRAAELVRGSSVDAGSAGAAGAVTGILIGVVLAAAFIALAVMVGKGSRVGRILTWVVGGIAVCCLGSVFALTQVGKAGFEQARKTDPNLPTWEAYNDAVYADVPGWYPTLTNLLSILAVLAILGAVILLALPASNPFFRKAQATQSDWEPPVPPSGPGQFGQPGPSTQPGQPDLGQPGYRPGDPGQSWPSSEPPTNRP